MAHVSTQAFGVCLQMPDLPRVGGYHMWIDPTCSRSLAHRQAEKAKQERGCLEVPSSDLDECVQGVCDILPIIMADGRLAAKPAKLPVFHDTT